jgi:hypothetical protein
MPNQIHLRLAAILTLMAAFATTGCSTRQYDGKWEGKTSQGKTISFTINGGVVNNTRVEFELTCERGGFCPAGGSIEQDVGAKLSGNSFSTPIGKAKLSGKFDSAGTAAGDIKVEENEARCGACTANVTWTAKKL